VLQSWPLVGQQGWDQEPLGTSQVVGQLLQGLFIEVSKVDHGGNPIRGELNNCCMWNPHLVVFLEERRIRYHSIQSTMTSCRLCSCQDHGVGRVAFVVDGSDKLLKYFLIHNTSLYQHEINYTTPIGLLVLFVVFATFDCKLSS
jgi:hypothetical protein